MQTPLSFANSNIYLNVLVGDIVDAKGKTVIKGVDARTAIKIIQAVNAHDAMTEALRDVQRYFDALVEMQPHKDRGTEFKRIREVVQDALAEGKTP